MGPFDREGFVGAATTGLDTLELGARVAHVDAALRAHLPQDWPAAVAHLVRAMPPAPDHTREVDARLESWPVVHAVGRFGVGHPDVALPALLR